jgi:hypothetical protein
MDVQTMVSRSQQRRSKTLARRYRGPGTSRLFLASRVPSAGSIVMTNGVSSMCGYTSEGSLGITLCGVSYVGFGKF